MPTFNGHRNWNAWNVSLHINNNENLYYEAKLQARGSSNRSIAAERFRDWLSLQGIEHTPDGAPYTKTSIKEAMRGIDA